LKNLCVRHRAGEVVLAEDKTDRVFLSLPANNEWSVKHAHMIATAYDMCELLKELGKKEENLSLKRRIKTLVDHAEASMNF